MGLTRSWQATDKALPHPACNCFWVIVGGVEGHGGWWLMVELLSGFLCVADWSFLALPSPRSEAEGRNRQMGNRCAPPPAPAPNLHGPSPGPCGTPAVRGHAGPCWMLRGDGEWGVPTADPLPATAAPNINRAGEAVCLSVCLSHSQSTQLPRPQLHSQPSTGLRCQQNIFTISRHRAL